MKDWNDYLDEKGFVIQKKLLGGDAGDSLNRTCAVEVLCSLAENKQTPFKEFANFWLLINDENKWRRSWQEPRWFAYWDRASRDQLTPLVIMLGLFSMNSLLKRTFRDHCKRLLLFTTNTRRNYVYPTLELQEKFGNPVDPYDYSWKLPDFTGPEFWALYARGFAIKWLYPLLLVFDIHTLLGSVVIRLNSDNDVLNHALILEYAKVRMDTFVMKLARRVTPRAFLQERLDRFFGVDIEPPINLLFKELK